MALQVLDPRLMTLNAAPGPGQTRSPSALPKRRALDNGFSSRGGARFNQFSNGLGTGSAPNPGATGNIAGGAGGAGGDGGAGAGAIDGSGAGNFSAISAAAARNLSNSSTPDNATGTEGQQNTVEADSWEAWLEAVLTGTGIMVAPVMGLLGLSANMIAGNNRPNMTTGQLVIDQLRTMGILGPAQAAKAQTLVATLPPGPAPATSAAPPADGGPIESAPLDPPGAGPQPIESQQLPDIPGTTVSTGGRDSYVAEAPRSADQIEADATRNVDSNPDYYGDPRSADQIEADAAASRPDTRSAAEIEANAAANADLQPGGAPATEAPPSTTAPTVDAPTAPTVDAPTESSVETLNGGGGDQLAPAGDGPGGDSGGCYITTAAVDHMGMKDDGPELGLLRGFRDNVMSQSPDGQAQVAEYDRVGPIIVQALNRRPDATQVYQTLFANFIGPSIVAIAQGDMDSAHDYYAQMVEMLEQMVPEAAQALGGAGGAEGAEMEPAGAEMPDPEAGPMGGMPTRPAPAAPGAQPPGVAMAAAPPQNSGSMAVPPDPRKARLAGITAG